MYYVQNKCTFLKAVRIQISKGLKKSAKFSIIFNHAIQKHISSYIHTEKFKTALNVTK